MHFCPVCIDNIGPNTLISLTYLDSSNIEQAINLSSGIGWKFVFVQMIGFLIAFIYHLSCIRLGVYKRQSLSTVTYNRQHLIPKSVFGLIMFFLLEISIGINSLEDLSAVHAGTNLLLDSIIQVSYVLHLVIIGVIMSVLSLVICCFAPIVRTLYSVFTITLIIFGFLITGIIIIAFCTSQARPIPTSVLPLSLFDTMLKATDYLPAVLTPYTFYLHSSLVVGYEKDGKIEDEAEDEKDYKKRATAHSIETFITMLLVLLMNISITLIFNQITYGRSYADLAVACPGYNFSTIVGYSSNSSQFFPRLISGGLILECEYGTSIKVLFAILLILSGGCSLSTGIYAGIYHLLGFVRIQASFFWRIAFMCFILLVFGLSVYFIKGNPMSEEIVSILNIIQMSVLPLTLLPLTEYAGNKASYLFLSITFLVVFGNYFTAGYYAYAAKSWIGGIILAFAIVVCTLINPVIYDLLCDGKSRNCCPTINRIRSERSSTEEHLLDPNPDETNSS